MTSYFDPDQEPFGPVLDRLDRPGAGPVVVGTEDRPRAVLISLDVFDVIAPAIDRARTELAAMRRDNPTAYPDEAFAELCYDLGGDPAEVAALMAEQEAAGFDPIVTEYRVPRNPE